MNIFRFSKEVVIGRARNLSDKSLFHKTSLIALLAWVGLGADGLSSSCYGPEAAFMALQGHHFLSLFVAAAVIVTIVVICASYSQIIELFPSGGGGYLVASKLLSPATGVVSGCALIGDYVLTIAISVASGTEALFSLLPHDWATVANKTGFAAAGVIFLSILNLRGVKESVLVWMPAFLMFIFSFAFAIIYGVATHIGGLPDIAHRAGLGCPRHHGQPRHVGIDHGGFARLQFRRGHVHGHRSREQQHGVVARTARANRQTHDGLYGQLALVRCRRIAADLPALSRHSGGGQNAERRPGGTNDRHMAGVAGKRFCDCRARFVGGAAVHRRANRIHRRPARAGQHGGGPLDADALRQFERPPRHPKRRPAHGRGGAGRHSLHGSLHGHAHRALQHQRLHHLQPIAARHGPPLVVSPRHRTEMAGQNSHQRPRPAAFRRHPRLALRREILPKAAGSRCW